MSSLREIKDRIGSVRSTLKITGAMKLVASAKLRKAQQAAQALEPYERTLSQILSSALVSGGAAGGSFGSTPVSGGGLGESFGSTPVSGGGARGAFGSAPVFGGAADGNLQKRREMPVLLDFSQGVLAKSAENASRSWEDRTSPKVAVVAVASNSSLCGSFNGNVLRKALAVLHSGLDDTSGEGRGRSLPAESSIDVFPIGRRIADPLRKAGYPSAADGLDDLVAHPSYAAASAFAESLVQAYNAGIYSSIILIYSHFVSASRQEVRCETYLPFEASGISSGPLPSGAAGISGGPLPSCAADFILEPSAASIVETLLPQVLRLKIYSVLLDSAASEHAARMIAMQTATDNAQDILDNLTLEYNKGRQQQITAEILDIVGGSQQ